MSSQKPGKTKQKSLLSRVKPQDTRARVEDENVEESCAAEIPEGSSESGQDYAAVKSVQPRERAGSTSSCFCMFTRNWQMVLTWWRSPICLWETTSQ